MGKHKSKHKPHETSLGAQRMSNENRNAAKTENPKKKFWCDWEPTERFTLVIAIFTIIYSVVTFGLYRIARDSLVISQRAFIFAEKVKIIGDTPTVVIPQPGNMQNLIVVSVTFKNSGQTVAKNEINAMNYYLTPTGIPVGFLYPMDPPTRPTILAPQTESALSKRISAEDLNAVKTEEKNLFVYGVVSYQDVFGKKHKTEYGFEWFGYTQKPNGEMEDYIFFSGPEHNCVDEDCQD